MPSPFPGMNPYLERAADWGDFHSAFVPYLRGAIERQLLEPFRTRIDENVYIHAHSAEERRLIGHFEVFANTPRVSSTAIATTTFSTPIIGGIPEVVELIEVPFLEILDLRNDSVVTTIEVPGPGNKDGSGDAKIYRTKVLKLLRSPANFVEIDLLRAG
ncbi:hypothetical protein BH11PLA2_BH11PLA2_36450 [soil metagenome]